MLYYTTYRLKNGKWQPTMIFENKLVARIEMDYHAKDRDYIIAKTKKELERRKKRRWGFWGFFQKKRDRQPA
ncbi:hypothetical protein ES703_85451 [subsurface metagenome]